MRVERFDTETLEALARLTRSAYPESELSGLEYMRWQYTANPAGPPELHVVNSADEIISQFVAIPAVCKVADELVPVHLSLNTITHPDHRGHGYFTTLAGDAFQSLEKKDHAAIIGFPNLQSIRGFTEKLGYSQIGTLPFLIRPLRRTGMIHAFLFGRGRRKGDDLAFYLDAASVFRNKEWCCTTVDPSDIRFIKLLERLQAGRDCTLLRTADSIRWRYLDCPTRKYSLLAVSDNRESEFKAYLVVRAVELMGFRCGVIVDIGVLEESALALSLDVIAGKLRQQKMDLIVAACSVNTPEYDSLLHNGFFRIPDRFLPQPLRFIVRTSASHPAASVLNDFSKWFLTFGDYDVL